MCPNVIEPFLCNDITDLSNGCRDGFSLLDESLNNALLAAAADTDTTNVFTSPPSSTSTTTSSSPTTSTTTTTTSTITTSIVGTSFQNMFASLDYTMDILFSSTAINMTNHWISDLQTVQHLLHQAEQYYPRPASWIYWLAAGCAIGLIVLSSYILLGTILLWKSSILYHQTHSPGMEQYPKPTSKYFYFHYIVRVYLVVPLFILLTVTCWCFALIFITFNIGTGDFCIDSPDLPILALLEQRIVLPTTTVMAAPTPANTAAATDSSQSLIYDFMKYHINDCPAVLLAKEMDDTNITATSTSSSSSSSSATPTMSMADKLRASTAPSDLDQRIRYLAQGVAPAIEQVLTSIQQIGTDFVQQHCEGGGTTTGTSSSNFNTLLLVMPTLQRKYCELAQSLVRYSSRFFFFFFFFFFLFPPPSCLCLVLLSFFLVLV